MAIPGERLIDDKQLMDPSMKEMAGKDLSATKISEPTVAPHTNPLAEAMAPVVRDIGLEAARILKAIESSNGSFNAEAAGKAAVKLREAYFQVQFIANVATSIVHAQELRSREPSEPSLPETQQTPLKT